MTTISVRYQGSFKGFRQVYINYRHGLQDWSQFFKMLAIVH